MDTTDWSTVTDRDLGDFLNTGLTPGSGATDPTIEQVWAYNSALREAATRGLIPDVADAGIPHFTKDGVRQFVNLALLLVDFYTKHKSTIDPLIETVFKDAMALLVNNRAALQADNQPGPN